MFCPNCGAKNSTDQNFCRACGIGLEEISMALATQLPAARSSALLSERSTAIEKIGRVGLIGLGTVGLIGVGAMIYTIFTKFILSGANIAGGIFFIAFMIFAVLTLAYVISRQSQQDKEKRRRAPSPVVVDDVSTAQLSDGNTAAPPSVTERTTRHLS